MPLSRYVVAQVESKSLFFSVQVRLVTLCIAVHNSRVRVSSVVQCDVVVVGCACGSSCVITNDV